MPDTLYKLIEQSARTALEHQGTEGAMTPGHNGPYHDLETPVRNTAHWLITFLKVFEITGERRFFAAAERAIGYLKSPSARPMHASFWCRKNPGKDFSNGLVGQAWVIESLASASRFFPNDDLDGLAAEVFLLHPYDEKRAAWRILNVDGSHGPLDLTFNHQLWFAAAGSLITGSPAGRVTQRIVGFLDQLEKHLAVYPEGLIRHRSASFLASLHINPVLRVLRSIRDSAAQTRLKPRSVGYHAFNLYGLALLKMAYPDHGFWFGRKPARVLQYAASPAFRAALPNNPFGFGYNPSGIELAYGFQAFKRETEKTAADWVSEQFRRSYGFESHMLDRGTEDPTTLAARIYEATRLPDMELNLSRVSPGNASS